MKKAQFCLGRILLTISFTILACYGPFAESIADEIDHSDENRKTHRIVDARISERGPGHRVWEQMIETTDSVTGQKSERQSKFTELADGLHYWDGEWKESKDLIEIVGNNAVARHGQHKVVFDANLNTEGAVDMQSRDGNRFRCRPIELRYFDKESGNVVVLATLKDSVGELLPPNRLIYTDAFDGLAADVLYAYAKNGFEQNIILLERPPSPESFDLNPATTQLQVVTEFIDPPKPDIRRVAVKRKVSDAAGVDIWFEVVEEILSFGETIFPVGRAFSFQGSQLAKLDEAAKVGPTGSFQAEEEIIVTKQWVEENRKAFLIESTYYRDLEPALKQLAASASSRPRKEGTSGETRRVQVASSGYSPKGVVLDFYTISGGTYSGYLFASGQTYYLSAGVSIPYGTATFQPGCVLKYNTSAYLVMNTAPVCPAAGTLMPVLTSKYDEKFGEIVATGTPGYEASYAIWISSPNSSATVRNLRIRYATRAVQTDGILTHTLIDCLIDNSQYGLYSNSGWVTMTNVRKCSVTNPAVGAVNGTMINDCGPFYTVANFDGLDQLQDNVTLPSDTMGAVGPRHFMSIMNGDTSVAVYSKFSGARVSPAGTTLSGFFSLNVPTGPFAGTYPTGGAFDPRIVYDAVDNRWIASAVDSGSRHVIVAVSNGADPSDPVGSGGSTWVSANWRKFLVPFGPGSTDYDTLGVDQNGIYVSAVQFSPTYRVRTAAMPKTPILNGSAPTVLDASYILDLYNGVGFTAHIMFPAVNLETTTANDFAWFIADAGLNLQYNAIKWVNGLPQWHFSSWGTLNYTRTFYQLGGNAIVAPQLGSSYGPSLKNMGGSRLQMAVVRKVNGTQYLYTCHPVGVNSAGNNTGIPADRSGIQWFKIQTSSTPTISSDGVLYDPAAANPRFYYTPSLTVNNVGDILIGFSASSAAEYIGAYYAGKRSIDASFAPVTRYYSGQTWFRSTGHFRWGDYTYTTLDPDGRTFWTIQQYAKTPPNEDELVQAFRTRIAGITPF